jgi:hypothetical protein
MRRVWNRHSSKIRHLESYLWGKVRGRGEHRDYAGTYARFDWETPERFNFGRDVVDRWAAQDRPAMIWRGAAGEERRLTFGDFSRLSNRFANAMRSLGVGPRRPGDGPSRQGAGVAGHPHGAPEARRDRDPLRPAAAGRGLEVPGRALRLRRHGLWTRGLRGGREMRGEAPGLEHFVSLGDRRDGWRRSRR